MRRSRSALSVLAVLALLVVPLVSAPAGAQPSAALAFASFAPADVARPGEVVELTGSLGSGVLGEASPTPLAGLLSLSLHGPEGQVVDLGTAVADAAGAFSVTVPADATAAEEIGTVRNGFRETWAVRAALADEPVAGAGALTFAQAAGVQVDYSFVSSVGWVKPGETYPATVKLTNFDPTASGPHTVTVAPVDGADNLSVRSAVGDAVLNADGSVTWTVPEVPAATDEAPTVISMVVVAQAASTEVDPRIVWKNLSATAVLDGGQQAVAHGPKVIPPSSSFDSARYGDRPFPVVPVEYVDMPHLETSSSTLLDGIINAVDNEGSTFNLFQEMSYGQLFPNGAVPSAGIATADFGYQGTDGEGFDFHTPALPPPNTCQGASTQDLAGTPLYAERISDGWYVLPGNTGFYGADSGGSNVLPSLGVPVPASIDSGCGDTGKLVYDAAAIADPEIDYNDFDTDKDGVVDFFMAIFAGCGGNGVSQLAAAAGCTNGPAGSQGLAPYDNIWPHSSTLEAGFRDAETGLLGYISDDRLTDLENNLLFYTDDTYTRTTTTETAFPAYVRVGPYNVNPETIFDAASVISHEYGHSLGLPDFYTIGGPDLYSEWNLMASDFSQHIDAFGRQELGWVVPTEIGEGTTTVDLVGSKTDIDRIEWQTPDGEPYVLEGEGVANGQMLRAGLPSRILIDPERVANGASPDNVYWSTSGNDYFCPTSPNARALDISLPNMADLAEGTDVELSFATSFFIEWDFDYGFVMVTTDNGETYESLPSEAGYTTPSTTNPNTVDCQATYGNGITGTNASWDAGSAELDRLLGEYPEPTGFSTDSYDLSAFAGQEDVVIRFAYVTDVGLAEPGWFIDDVAVTADGQELYRNDFEGGPGGPQIFNGGCQADSGLGVAPICADGFAYVNSADGSPADHAYYLELRDRSGFDVDGFGQSDRGDISWAPGVSLGFTDEAFSYGNVSNSDRPGQHVIDASPVPEDAAPDLSDAAFNVGEVFSDAGEGWVDNFTDPNREDGLFRFDFDCLTVEVLEEAGLEVGPEDDITATVEVTRGPGCVERDFGYDDITVSAQRIAGPGRVETAIELAKAAYPDGADTVLVARAGDFPDALAAAPLAAAVDGPILLTGRDGLDAGVAAELERLAPTSVYLLGGEGALSADVEAALAGVDVTRLAGAGRVETAAAVARELASVSNTVDSAVVVRADDFADALAASNLAVPGGDPILLTGPDGLDPASAAVLAELVDAGSTVFLAGGTGALSDAVRDDIAAAGFSAKRLAGSSRFGTARSIITEALATTDLRPSTVILASGATFPDALAAAPVAAQLRALLVLVDPTDLASSPEALELLRANAGAIERVVVAGGTAAVSDAVLEQAVAALGG